MAEIVGVSGVVEHDLVQALALWRVGQVDGSEPVGVVELVEVVGQGDGAGSRVGGGSGEVIEGVGSDVEGAAGSVGVIGECR